MVQHPQGPQALTQSAPKSKPEKIKVICLECGKKFQVAVYADTCPRCGGADIDVRES